MNRAALGLALCACVFALDQASKLYLILSYDLPARSSVALTPFFNLTAVWNYGVSYGLFQKTDAAWQWFLIALKVTVALILTFYLFRARSLRSSLSFALIIGGALGNATDRILHGAVFDFAHLHIGDFSWYVFNLADVAIVTGAIWLFFIEIRERKRLKREASFSHSATGLDAGKTP